MVESGLQSKAIHETKRAAKRVTKVAVATGKQLKEKRAQWGQQFRRMGEARNMVEARNKLIIKIKQPKQHKNDGAQVSALDGSLASSNMYSGQRRE